LHDRSKSTDFNDPTMNTSDRHAIMAEVIASEDLLDNDPVFEGTQFVRLKTEFGGGLCMVALTTDSEESVEEESVALNVPRGAQVNIRRDDAYVIVDSEEPQNLSQTRNIRTRIGPQQNIDIAETNTYVRAGSLHEY